MINKIYYVTYQTFPADTANSLQTISNIKYLVKEGFEVHLYFPLREKRSSTNLDDLKTFYEFDEHINVFGLKHNYPHGKLKYFKKLSFHISHFLWAKKLISTYFNEHNDEIFITRSDWVAYFLAKKGYNVTFECHQTSRLRDRILKKITNLDNLKVIFLNENLKKHYSYVNKSIILHNAVDTEIFNKNQNSKIKNKVIFVGNLSRFNKDRGLKNIINWFNDKNIKDNFTFEIIGGDENTEKEFNKLILENQLSNIVKISKRKGRKETIEAIQQASIGLLINTPDNLHSFKFTSPLKYFEYLYAGLAVVAVDFPSHRILPFQENIGFFDIDNKESFYKALLKASKIKNDFQDGLDLITLKTRAKKIINFVS